MFLKWINKSIDVPLLESKHTIWRTHKKIFYSKLHKFNVHYGKLIKTQPLFKHLSHLKINL